MINIKNEKKKIIEMELEKYVTDNVINIYKFRKDNPKLYSLIPHYFGSINELLNQKGWIKIQQNAMKNGRMTLRNKLAYDRLYELRIKEGKTLEEIAKNYGVSRALINQLYQALGKFLK